MTPVIKTLYKAIYNGLSISILWLFVWEIFMEGDWDQLADPECFAVFIKKVPVQSQIT